MADGYDRFDNEGGGGGSFVMGLLTGTVLGAASACCSRPKAGSELRNQLSEQAGNSRTRRRKAIARPPRARVSGRRAARKRPPSWPIAAAISYDKAKDAVNRGTEEAQRYVRDAASKGRRQPPRRWFCRIVRCELRLRLELRQRFVLGSRATPDRRPAVGQRIAPELSR